LVVRFACVIVFAIALTHAVGLADLVMDDACGEVCDDDGCGKDCLPGVACRCHCPSAMPLLGGQVQKLAKLDAPRVIALCSVDQRMHASPDPREILHVPRHVV
jgi:hypothetical protein